MSRPGGELNPAGGPDDRDPLPFTTIALTLLGLTGVAVAQPLYDLVGQNPEFLVAHRATRADLLLLTAFLSLAVPLSGALVAWLAGRISRHLGGALVGTMVTTLVALFLIQVLKELEVAATLPTLALVGLVLLGGGSVALAHARSAKVRTFTMILAAGALLFPAVFLSQPSLRALVTSHQEGADGNVWNRSDIPVVLVVFDQLPLASLLDHRAMIDPSLYPSFARLADEGTWYRNATTVANKSAWAVPAILTGQTPDPERRLPSWQDYRNSLFHALHPHYSMRIEEPVTELCPPEICETTAERLSVRVRSELIDLGIVYAHVVTPPDWARRLPALTDNWRDFGASAKEHPRTEYLEWRQQRERWDWTERWVSRRDSDRRRGFREFVRSIGSERQPAFYFAHVLLPHEPYEFLPSGRVYPENASNPSLRPDGSWSDDEHALREVYQRHLLQVAHVDRLLGQLLERLDGTGLYERSLVVVTADHGASFRPGDRFKDPTSTNFADILSVPLIIKPPEHRGGTIDDRNAETIDIVPTIADFLDAEVDWSIAGESLLGPVDERDRDKTIFYGAAHGKIGYRLRDVVEGRRASLARKLALFDKGNPLRRAGSELDRRLVGKAVADFRQGTDPRVDAQVDRPDLFVDVDPGSGFVPARLTGTVSGPGVRTSDEGIELAIGLNGVVAATTRTRPDADGDGESTWSVILPEAAFVQGNNDLEILTASPAAGRPRLATAYGAGDRVRVAADNLVLTAPTARWMDGVELRGFRDLEWDPNGLPVRWTRPRAAMRVPIDPESPPVGIDLHVRYVDPRGHRLRLKANGCTFFRRRVRDAFEERLSFGDCSVEGSELHLEFVSDHFEPEPRPLGVGLSFVVLVDDGDATG